MGTTEGLTFVTPSLAYGTGCPDADHRHLATGTAVEYLTGGAPCMVIVKDEDAARFVMAELGMDRALIDDRIRFGQTGEVTVTG